MTNEPHNIVIGFDMDGVVLDHTDSKIRLAAKKGYEVRPDQTPSAVLRTLMPRDEYRELQERLYFHPKESFLSPAMPGAFEGLSTVKEWGVPYFLISARRDGEHAGRLLAHQDLWPSIFDKDNTFFVDSKDSKNDIAKELGITHYVDDGPEVLARLRDVPNKALFDLHRTFSHLEQYPSYSSWEELLDFLKV